MQPNVTTKRVTMTIPIPVEQALRERAKRDDRPMSRIVARALEVYLGLERVA